MSFSTLLIANRGEIACRIQRTAQAMGYRTVAVFTDVDARAPHVAMADRAVRIGAGPVGDSYLDGTKLIQAARRAGADAIHPGYGFLAENADFAQACLDAGLIFVGPPPEAIRLMGSKRLAKLRMKEAGVPTIPGYSGAAQETERLIAEAGRLGLPLMIKASSGGGGRGLRLVTDAAQLAAQLESARQEALHGFRDGELILEVAIREPRHVEIQVFADNHGQVIHLGERDCSVQRRHQKVIEEAPSPAVTPELRAAMGEAAVTAARAIGYRGAGTCEFLLGPDGAFYFMEMNTRLQVEHPVTEMVTGFDLVAWQLDVAAGKPLPVRQEQVRIEGHAIEVRLYAEDCHAGFVPQTGRILDWRPAEGSGVRVDAGIVPGLEVSPYYDSMLAKIIAHGPDREAARRRLLRALAQCRLHGLVTNLGYLSALLRHPEFVSGQATTAFIGRHFAPDATAPEPSGVLVALAALLLLDGDGSHDFWRSAGPAPVPVRLGWGETERALEVTPLGASFRVSGPGIEHEIALRHAGPGELRFCCEEVWHQAFATRDGETLWLSVESDTFAFERRSLSRARNQAAAGAARVLAPMAGRIIALKAAAGAEVTRGQLLAVLEAMKMQHELVARTDGRIAAVHVNEGDQVATRQLLVTLEAGT